MNSKLISLITLACLSTGVAIVPLQVKPTLSAVPSIQAIAQSPSPTSAEDYFNRGVGYAELGNYQQAIADFSAAIRLNPNYAKAYSKRGVAYAQLGNYQQAIDDFNTAIRLNPNLERRFSNRRGVSPADDLTVRCANAPTR